MLECVNIKSEIKKNLPDTSVLFRRSNVNIFLADFN